MEKQKFKHTFSLRVRNYEVDWQGIVHNSYYLLYCEVGRIEYLRQLGVPISVQALNADSKVVLVRNEINYIAPALFDEVLTVYTRVASIRNTSFIMEGFLERASDGVRIAENVAYHAWLDPQTNNSRRVPDDFRERIRNFEGENCEIQDRTRSPEEQPVPVREEQG